MISESALMFCLTPYKIENYEQAIADKTQVWECHHRLETHYPDGTKRPRELFMSKKELMFYGCYFNRPAEELIFLTKAEHRALHHTGNKARKGLPAWNKGNHDSRKPLTQNVKQKISKALKGKPKSAQHIENMRKTRLGRKVSIETRKKMSEAQKRAWAKRKGE